MIHREPHPMAGRTVKIRADATHLQVPGFGSSEYRVEDWWDRVSGGSWMFAKGNPAALVYAMRSATQTYEVPTDDEVLYEKVGPFGHLIHVCEIEAAYSQAMAQFKVGNHYATFSEHVVEAWGKALAKACGEVA